MSKSKTLKTPKPLDHVPDKKGEHFSFCTACDGKGIDTTDDTKHCTVCQGSGMVKA